MDECPLRVLYIPKNMLISSITGFRNRLSSWDIFGGEWEMHILLNDIPFNLMLK